MYFQLLPLVLFLSPVFSNVRHLTFANMGAARQQRKKEEEKRAKGKEGVSSLAPKAISKGSAKRNADGKDNRPPKKAAITPGDAHPKKKSPPKSSHVAGKGMMTSTGPIAEGLRCLLTHKDYAVKTVESFIKPMHVEPCVGQGTEELGASALFNLSHVSSFSSLILSHLFLFIN